MSDMKFYAALILGLLLLGCAHESDLLAPVIGDDDLRPVNSQTIQKSNATERDEK